MRIVTRINILIILKMKKNLLFVCMLVLCISTFAQSSQEKNLPGYKTSFETNNFGDNWFVSLNFGAQALYAEGSTDAKFGDRLTFMPALSVGKWFAPWWGVRVQGQGGALHGFQNNGNTMLHKHYGAVHGDFMFGLLNFFGRYNEKRCFDLVPFAGIGGAFIGSDQSFTINAGVQARFRLCERFDLNLEYSGMILDDDLVTRGGFPNDGIMGLSVGVTYRFKNRSFKKAVSYKQYAELQTLTKAQEAQIQELLRRAPDTVVKIVKQEVPTTKTDVEYKALPTTINFAFNSYKIDATQEVGIYNLAQFLKENPDVRIRLTGYADKRGTQKANMIISEKRVNAVADMFINKYGISKQRVVKDHKGVSSRYDKDEWNRCVLVEIIK